MKITGELNVINTYNIVKEIVLDGKVYVDVSTAMFPLCTTYFGDFAKWRKAGMPCVAIRWKKQIKYFYNIDDCKRWFAGEDFAMVSKVYEKCDVCAT